jgi:hypothetical protein
MTPITAEEQKQWEAYVALEPGLALLLGWVQEVRDDPAKPSFCANVHWYGTARSKGFKGILCRLVGWGASPKASPVLRTAEAYDFCYDFLYAALPDCRNCQCLSGAFWEAEPLPTRRAS